MKTNIYSSLPARAYLGTHRFDNLLEYLITHQYLFLDDLASTQLLTTRIAISSTISDLAGKIIHEGYGDLFSFMKIRPKEDNIPELLSTRQIPLDMMQAQAIMPPALAGALEAQPTMYNKILLNVTPFVQSSGQLSDAIGFQSALVRDALSRSYFSSDKTTWISPNFTQIVSKVYSIALGTSVSQWYRLDVKTLNILTFFFAYFYLIKMSDVRTAKGVLTTQWKKFYIPDPNNQKQLFGLIAETIPDGELNGLQTLDDVIKIILALGIPRLKLDRSLLYNRMRSSFSSDALTTALCLEYPPALAHLIMQAFSGIPIALSYKMKTSGLNKSKPEFEDEILRSRVFIDSLN